MKTLFKVLGWLVVVVVLLAIGLVVALTIFVDPNDFREEIAGAVKKQTGRDLNIEGDLKLTYYPWLGLSTGKVVLANREGFGDTPMLQIDGAKVRAKLLPLLKKQIEVDTVVLESPKIDLQVNAQGELNWGDLVPKDGADKQQSNAEDAGAGVGALALNGVEITNGDVSWRDASTGQDYQVTGLTLKTGDILKGKPTGFETVLTVSGDGIPNTVTIALNTTVTADLDNKKLILDDMDFSAKGEGVDASLQTPKLSVDAGKGVVNLTSGALAGTYQAMKADLSLGSVNFDMNAQQLAASDIVVNASGSLEGQVGPMVSAIKLGKLDFNIAEQKAVIAQLSGTFDGTVEGVGGPFKASIDSSAVDAALKDQSVAANDLKVTFDGALEGVGGPMNVSLDSGPVQANISKQSGTLSDVKLSFDGTLEAVEGPLKADMTVAGLQADMTSEQFEINDANVDADLDGKAATVTFPSATANLDAQTASVPEIIVAHADALVKASVLGEQIIDAPAFSGQVSAQPFNLRKLMSEFDIAVDTLSPDALAKVGLDTQFQTTKDSVNLSGLSAAVDESNIKGSVAVNGFAAPAYGFDLSIDQVDLDKLLVKSDKSTQKESGDNAQTQTAGESSAAEESTGAVAAPAAAATQIPVETLRGLNAEGKMKIGALRYSGIDMNNVEVGLNAKDGLVQVSPLNANLYSGSISGSTVVDATGVTPAIKVNNQFNGIDVGALLQDAKISDKLEGIGNFNIDLSAQGATDKAMMASNNGTMGFEFRDGALKGFDIQKMVLDARSVLDKLTGDEADVDANLADETKFTELSGVINFNNGIASNNDLSLKAPVFRVGGDGSANIVDQTVNYLLSVTVVRTAEGQAGKDLSELEGVTIPISVKGALADPKFSVDMKELVKSRVDKQLAAEKEKLKEELELKEAAAKAKLEAEEAEAKAKLESKLEQEKAKLKEKLGLESLGSGDDSASEVNGVSKSAGEDDGVIEGETKKERKKRLRKERKKKLLESLGG